MTGIWKKCSVTDYQENAVKVTMGYYLTPGRWSISQRFKAVSAGKVMSKKKLFFKAG